jgi:hypothetical protein
MRLTTTSVRNYAKRWATISLSASIVPVAAALVAYPVTATRIPIRGHYERPNDAAKYGEDDSASLDVWVIAPGRIAVCGAALAGKVSIGPHTGDLEFQSAIANGQASYQKKNIAYGLTPTYRLTLRFLPRGLFADEQGSCEDCGLNVSFAGKYRLVGPPEKCLQF